MKTGSAKIALLFTAFFCLLTFSLSAQTNTAVNIPAGTPGNLSPNNWAFGEDFYVNQPITIWQLGVFDDLTNGINGGATLTAQLYSHQANAGTLLESLSFDAANPGTLKRGSRFKPLSVPVTLLPGPYSILSYGFDQTNLVLDSGRPPYSGGQVPWTLNNGAGLIQFEVGRHGKALVDEFPHGLNTNRPDYFAAATFTYSGTTLPAPPYAADYAMLTAGVNSTPFGGQRRVGSLALFGYNSFPVMVEPSGNRLIIEAAGKYNDDPNGGRCVAFTHSEWGRVRGDARSTLFENAVGWASRKSNPTGIVVGMGPDLDTNYFVTRGYQVVLLPTQLNGTDASMPVCDVMVVNWNTPYDDAAAAQIAQFTAHGGGLVVTMMPWLLVHEGVKPALGQINAILQPYGLAYRPSTEIPRDLRFTNILAQPYPVYFSAYPAAQLLGQDHLGQIKLTSLEKVIAMNTINYVLNARPDLMTELTTLSSGGGNGAPGQVLGVNFVDAIVLNASQASTNHLGQWIVDGTDLVSQDRRGIVEYNFNTSSADVYQLQIYGTQDNPRSQQNDFDLMLSLDGVSLGHHHLIVTNGVVSCLTPYILAGAHTLRIFWDNPASFTSLRLHSIHVQTGLGSDSDGNGIKDWVDQLVHSQSGLDNTNASITSLVSPICIEGRDPYPSLMQLAVPGSTSPTLRQSPNGRWYSNVPLPPDQNTPLVLQVNYQNGALSETRTIQWQAVNLITSSNLTVRQGDRLLLTAWPPGMTNAPIVLMVGTNQHVTTAASPTPFAFNTPGTFTVTGTYRPNSLNPQTASITVKVVGHQFPASPDAWKLNGRYWDILNVPPEAVFDWDSRILFQQVTMLPTNGIETELITDENEPRFILSRLGNGGPILDSAKINSFQFWSSEGTYTKVIQTYNDGSQLVESLLILSPVPPDLTIQMDVDVGGVIFTDGTTSKTFSSLDFDNLGQLKVQFIRPASARTSVCHSVRLYQGGVLVGQIQ